ncbi:MAG: hypothetical protein WAP03_20810 [Methylorubrum rhodinum]|uniref:hypothetical protein n=1 Tax=Methylorubrum rhodinum TaxID=29428 RepID=UPI003BB1DD2A
MSRGASVILPPVLLFRKEEDGIYASGALLPNLLEQMVVAGATRIVITDSWRYKDTLPSIPSVYNNYICISNDECRAREIVIHIFDPIFNDIGIETDNGIGFRRINSNLEEEIFQDAVCSFCDLITFITAIFCKSQVQLDIDTMNRQLLNLLKHLGQPKARAQIACILPVFASYQKLEIDGLCINHSKNIDLADRLHEIIRSVEYQALSESRFNLGIGHTLSIVTSDIKQKIKNLLARRSAKSVLGYSSSIASAATGIPIPKSDLVESFLGENFLPPTVDLRKQISSAQSQFRRTVVANKSVKYLGYNEDS